MLKNTLSLFLALCMAGTTSSALPDKSQATLQITELMASNSMAHEDAFGNSSDWLEIYNYGDKPVSLNGMALSDNKKELERYLFSQDAVILPGEYLIVYASGAKKDVGDEYHTSFKLSALGEAVYLSIDGVLIDAVLFGSQETDVSWALDTDGEYRKSWTPTPGTPNLITPDPSGTHE